MSVKPKPERKALVHVDIGHDLHHAAVKRARAEDRSTASLVRRALRELLERVEAETDRQRA
jgi:hypothetical protein